MSQNKVNWEFEKGYRSKKRAQFRAKRTVQLKIIAIFIALAAMSVLAYFWASKYLILQKDETKVSKAATEEEDSSANNKSSHDTATQTTDTTIEKIETGITTFGIVAGGSKNFEESSYHAIVVANGGEAKIVSITGDLIVETASSSYEKLKSIVKLYDLTEYQKALETIWQGEIKYYLHLSSDFGDLSPGNLAEAFLKTKSSNLSAEQRFNWNEKIKNTTATKYYFPAKEIIMGGEKFSQPIESEVDSLFKRIGLDKTGSTNLKTKVLIFNGSGIPGAGGKSALKLLKSGFLVDDVKNLKDEDGKDDFSQAETVIYGDPQYDKEIDRVIDTLESGKKVDKKNTYVGMHIIVIIGKDFKK